MVSVLDQIPPLKAISFQNLSCVLPHTLSPPPPTHTHTHPHTHTHTLTLTVAESERASLQQEVEGLKVVVASLREESHRRQGENAALQRNLQRVQGKCQERIKV